MSHFSWVPLVSRPACCLSDSSPRDCASEKGRCSQTGRPPRRPRCASGTWTIPIPENTSSPSLRVRFDSSYENTLACLLAAQTLRKIADTSLFFFLDSKIENNYTKDELLMTSNCNLDVLFFFFLTIPPQVLEWTVLEEKNQTIRWALLRSLSFCFVLCILGQLMHANRCIKYVDRE